MEAVRNIMVTVTELKENIERGTITREDLEDKLHDVLEELNELDNSLDDNSE